MVYVTHDQIEAMSMADRIAVINLGVLQQYASPIEIYNNPANLFVAKFIGSPSMNFLKCRLLTDGGATKLDFGAAGCIVVTDPKLVAQSRQAHKQDVVFGARPEQLELRRDNGHASSLSMTATFVEQSWRPHHCASGARRSNPESGRKERLSSRARRTEVGDRATGCGNAI